ncbi:MAG: 4Fe-4S binding protein [bacterium]
MSDIEREMRPEKHKVGIVEEVLDRLDPSERHENVLPTTRGLVVAIAVIFGFFWCLYASMAVFYGQALDVDEITFGLFALFLPPLLIFTAALLALYWFLAGVFTSWTEWGRANPRAARWFWFLGLSAVSYVLIDPFNIILERMSNFSIVGKTDWLGMEEINLGVIALYLAIFLLVLALGYESFSWVLTRFARNVALWHEMLVSILLGMKVTLVHFGRRPITEQYPEEKPDLSPIFRGRHMLAFDEKGEHLCIACKACEKICPDRLIAIESVRNPETKKLVLTGFILDNSRCSFCGLCEDVCPTGAIRHSTEYAYSSFTRNDLVLDILGEYYENTKRLKEAAGEAK